MKTCLQCQDSFELSAEETSFLNKMTFRFGTVEISMPDPQHCADCRNQIRTSHRNEQHLYNRKSDRSGKQMISVYTKNGPRKQPWTVYTQEEWNSDDWDPLEYGKDFNFNRPFFEQFYELQRAVPRQCLVSLGNENSPYTTGTGYCKNCHLINSSENCEDCYYGKLLQSCRSSMDCSYLYDSELCYECFSCHNCYSCGYLSYSKNCSDCWFSENLSGCKHCFFCTNLSNKEYYFMNEPFEKEEYFKQIEAFKGSYRNLQKAKRIFEKICHNRIHKYSNISNSEDCSGDFISNSKNCLDCYDVSKSEDCRHIWVGVELKDCQHGSNLYLKQELVYETLGTINAYMTAFTLYNFHCSNVLYSDQVYHSEDLFGCVGLKKKRYCVFNKQYSKKEYEELVPKIIQHMKRTGEWGQFFPPQYSPHGYNESLAMDYYPLSEAEVKKQGWNWHQDQEGAAYQGPKAQIPEQIQDVDESVLQQILTCEVTGQPYKIMKQELSLYQKLKLPIPRRCPDQRHTDRMQRRNPRRLYERNCTKCQFPLQTPYSAEMAERIYCESCYSHEVYS